MQKPADPIGTTPNPPPLSVHANGATLLFGLEVFIGSMAELLDQMHRSRQHNEPKLIVTANVDHLINLAESQDFRNIYSRAAFRLLDGAPLVALSRRLGAGSAQRLTGADLLTACARESNTRGWRIAVLGSDRTSQAAAQRLSNAHPGSDIRAIAVPLLTSAGDRASLPAIQEITDLSPDVVFICLGSPKQEQWFVEWKNSLPPALYVGAGAAAEFAAGDRRRAPVWAQRLGLEWMWRVAQEPNRLLGRYIIKGPRFLQLRRQSLRAARSFAAVRHE